MTRKTTQRLRKAVSRLDGLPIMPEYLLASINQPSLELPPSTAASWALLPHAALGLPATPQTAAQTLAINALMAVMEGFAAELDAPFHQAFWKNGLACAVASLKLASQSALFQDIDRVELWCAAALHDVGKLVLKRVDAQAFNDVLELARERALLFCEAGRDLLGVVHHELGGHFAQAWLLPQALRTGIGLDVYQPDDLTEGDRLLIILVELGNFFANHLALGFSGNRALPVFPSDAVQRIGLGQAEVNAVVAAIQDTLPCLAPFLDASATACQAAPEVYSAE